MCDNITLHAANKMMLLHDDASCCAHDDAHDDARRCKMQDAAKILKVDTCLTWTATQCYLYSHSIDSNKAF
jgi:hypothetical protein